MGYLHGIYGVNWNEPGIAFRVTFTKTNYKQQQEIQQEIQQEL
jgi:ATP-dependent DNA helicase RecG